MNHAEHVQAYGLWTLVFLNSAIIIFFAYSFARPSTRRDWRSLGAFSAFIVALFAEMYGFPLTIYLLSGWLGRKYPQVDLLSHDAGHLLYTLLGFKGNPHSNPLHILSDVLIIGGFFLLANSWKILFAAQKEKKLATGGPYSYVRHPQYDGFILIMLGFLFQWPTILTVLMFPILVVMYVRLAHSEEREVTQEFGNQYLQYARVTPAFFPKWSRVFGGHPQPPRVRQV